MERSNVLERTVSGPELNYIAWLIPFAPVIETG